MPTSSPARPADPLSPAPPVNQARPPCADQAPPAAPVPGLTSGSAGLTSAGGARLVGGTLFSAQNTDQGGGPDPAGDGAAPALRSALIDAETRRRSRYSGRPRAAGAPQSDDPAAGGTTSLGTVETNAVDLTAAADWGFDITSGRWLGILPDGRRLWAAEDPRGGGRVSFDPPPASPAELLFRHSGWLDTRGRIRAAMAAAGVGHKRLEAFDQCGGGSWVFVNPDTREAKLCGSYCHDRFCLPCARARSMVLVENLSQKIQPGAYLHVVLTLRGRPGDLRPQLEKLYKSWSKLKAHKLWKKWTGGGAAVLEIKLGERSGWWHPHLHVVAESRLKNGRGQPIIPHGELSALWLKITGDSDNVWISRVTDARGAAEEIATYVAKPIHRQLCRAPDALREMVKALKGRRLCMTFGSWRGWRLMDRIERPDAGRWYRYGSLLLVMAKARNGDAECQRILFQLELLATARNGRAPPWFGTGPPPVFDLSQLRERNEFNAGDADAGEAL